MLVSPASTLHRLGVAEPLGDRRETVVARAIDDLRRRGDASARAEVLALSAHRSPHVHAAVLRYAARLAPDAARPLLVAALEHPHYAVREDAVRSLEELGRAEALRQVRRLLEDGHPAVRAAAERFLACAGVPPRATPEEAARGDIPVRHARAVGTARSPGHAVVLLALGEGPAARTRQVVVRRRGGGWVAGPGAPEPGWTPTEHGLGVSTLWGRMPGGGREVVVGWWGEEHVVPVRDDHFLFARWDVPEPAARPELLRAPV